LDTNAYHGQPLTLSSSAPVLTLDYGTETGGFAYIDVASVTGPCEIEFKFTEAFAGLNSPYGDGPWTFSNGLSGTFSTETFNITGPGRIEAYFLQGGFRFQSITLSPGSNSVILKSIGVDLTVARVSPELLPGYFTASNPIYTDIADLGARAVQAACVDAYSQPSTWKVTPDGVYLQGQQPASSSKSAALNDLYNLTFSSKIIRGGTGWTVDTSPASPAGGSSSYFVLTSNYPSGSTFRDTNTSLVPTNTLTFGYGRNLVNQTSLVTGPVVHYKVPFDITEDEWHRISTMLTSDGYIISVDGNVAANVSMSAYKALYPPTAYPVTGGAIGFGPFEDEIAYVKDVKVIGSNGTILYSNPMTSDDLYYEFGVHENTDSVCLDGAKRDRLVWTGDFAHTARTLGTTTHRLDYIRGTVDFCFNRQASNGFVPVQAAMGSPPEPLPPPFFLQDYQLLFLLSIYDYYVQSADLNFVRGHWTNINAIISGMKLLIEPSTNLVGSSGFYFLGPGNGTAVTSMMVYTLRRTAVLATALGDTSTASQTQDALTPGLPPVPWAVTFRFTSDPGNSVLVVVFDQELTTPYLFSDERSWRSTSDASTMTVPLEPLPDADS